MRRFLLAVPAITVLASCQPAPTELTDAMKVEIVAEVDAAVSAWWAAVDYDRGMTFSKMPRRPDGSVTKRTCTA